MVRKVITAPAAAKGLRDARSYLTQPGSGPNGRKKWQSIRSALRLLKDRPYAGPKSFEHSGCRCVIRDGYLIVYEVIPDTGITETAGDVFVLAVFPPGIGNRDLP